MIPRRAAGEQATGVVGQQRLSCHRTPRRNLSDHVPTRPYHLERDEMGHDWTSWDMMRLVLSRVAPSSTWAGWRSWLLPIQPVPPVKQPFVRSGAAGSRAWSKGRDAFRPDPSATHQRAAQGKGGAVSRRDRSHAQRPFGREHGEHGEDPPLTRSEHRGTPTVGARKRARLLAGRLVHRTGPGTIGNLSDSNYRFVLQSARALLLQSARAFCYKVPVDNSTNSHDSQGICTTMPVRPFTGGGLCRSVMPLPSNSTSAARYWLCTWRKVCRNMALKLFMRP